ncbi:MAG: pitrilysin family protein [Parcubacteria group bacterium]
MADIPYVKKVFPNGMRYIFIPESQSRATTVLVLVSTGSEYEGKEINGVSHFLEHLCFKGTKKRPGSALISTELDSLGAEYNAFTGNEVTGYFAKAANKNFPKVLDVVSDLYLNPLIPEGEMDKERGVIIEEINMYEDLPPRKVWDDLSALMYGDQPAGRMVLGTKEIIKKLTRKDIMDYRNLHYVAPKTTVVVAGGLGMNPEPVIAEYFGGISSGESIAKPKTEERQSGPQVFFRDKTTDQTHMLIGVRAFDLFDERRFTLTVLSEILGGSMSSRLWKKLREEMGVAYHISSASNLCSDYGILSVSAGIDKERIAETTKAIIQELKTLRDEPVKEEELNKAKEHISGSMILQLETSDEIAEFYGGEEAVTGRIQTPDEILEKIKNVTAEDISLCAKAIMTDDRINLSAIGPISENAKEGTKNVFKLS